MFNSLVSQPLFIVFEGIDGSGTTTQAGRLYQALRRAGHPVVLTREPGGTPLSERIRLLLLDPAAGELDDTAELLLYGASRRQHVTQLIRPSLEAGKPVISDRYAASTVAYQGVGRGLGVELARQVNEIAMGKAVPDLTICLDLDIEVAARRRRLRGEGEDRLEQAGGPLQAAVRGAYRHMAEENPVSWILLDASPAPDLLEHTIDEQIRRRFPLFPYRSS